MNPEKNMDIAVSDLPSWVTTLSSDYITGSANFFILHGNVDDVVGSIVDTTYRLETLTDFLGRYLLKTFDLVLHYDLGRGLRIHPAGDPVRESRMKELLGHMWPELSRLPHEPTPMLRLMDQLVTRLLSDAKTGLFRKTAFLFDYAELICPPDDRQPEHLATFLNWAKNPKIRRINMVFILMTSSLTRLNSVLVESGYTTAVQIPMPGLNRRRMMIEHRFPAWRPVSLRLATLSAGLTLHNLSNLLRPVSASPDPTREVFSDATPLKGSTGIALQARTLGKDFTPLDGNAWITPPEDSDTWEILAAAKKQLIEAQCPGLVEFVEPKFHLNLVAGHVSAKARFTEDSRLIREGHLDAVPMGYLLCGPVGVGKTFMAMCYAGSVGIPSVILKNFRSKYVGETEANLEKILRVLGELGPVAVIIDEADAAVGNRGMSGDAGTSSRVFAQLAARMGDTDYRGKTLWFLLTSRPDLLPVDLKRQGRCEEHVPLFYPETPEERTDMFVAMGKKLGMDLSREDIPESGAEQALSGADIEALLTRVRRESLIGRRTVDRETIATVQETFRSPRGPEHELQILAAIMECSDLRYLPPRIREAAQTPAGWDELGKQFYELKMRFDRR